MSDCACGNGPWIKLSQCGIATMTPDGVMASVRCPSTFCMGMQPIADGRIGQHDGIVPGRCPWIGTRVVDDRGDFAPGRTIHPRGGRVASLIGEGCEDGVLGHVPTRRWCEGITYIHRNWCHH